MKLHLLSHNVRGLNDPSAIDRFKHYILNSNPKANIIFFQEHKTRGSRLVAIKTALAKQFQCWASEATPGYATANLANGAGKGGVGILIPHSLTHLVTESGQVSNRLLWIRLSGLPGGDICLANIYASNHPRERSELLEQMVLTLPTNC